MSISQPFYVTETAWSVPAGPPPVGQSADLLCAGHTEQILASLIWPADLEPGAANACADRPRPPPDRCS
jgi:hypothetical protein